MEEKFMKFAYLESIKAMEKDDVPVGAVLVRKNKIIAKGYNNRSCSNSVIGHAEIIVINKANKKLRNWRLDECDLYVTLKPCKMCMEVIREAKIKCVYYMLDPLVNKKNRYIDNVSYQQFDFEFKNKYNILLSDFFSGKR